LPFDYVSAAVPDHAPGATAADADAAEPVLTRSATQ